MRNYAATDLSTDVPFKYKNPNGLIDILPESQRYWCHIENLLSKLSNSFGYRRLITPSVDAKSLYKLAFGNAYDDFLIEANIKDEGEDYVLRAHPRIGVIRSFIENKFSTWPPPLHLYYQTDTMQRHGSAWDQQHYFCLDILEAREVTTQASLMVLLQKLAKELHLKNSTVIIHSNGCDDCKPAFAKTFAEYCHKYKNDLCEKCAKEPLQTNISSCEIDGGQEWFAAAPSVLDNLCPACHSQLTDILEICDQLGLPYDLNSTFFVKYPEAEQTTFGLRIAGEMSPAIIGYHYSRFASRLAEKPMAALGLTIDLPLLSSYLEGQHTTLPTQDGIQIFVAQLGQHAKSRCVPLLSQLYEAGYSVVTACESESIAQQLQVADRLRARITLIVGQKEAVNNHVILRDMLSGLQDDVHIDDLVPSIAERLAVAY